MLPLPRKTESRLPGKRSHPNVCIFSAAATIFPRLISAESQIFDMISHNRPVCQQIRRLCAPSFCTKNSVIFRSALTRISAPRTEYRHFSAARPSDAPPLRLSKVILFDKEVCGLTSSGTRYPLRRAARTFAGPSRSIFFAAHVAEENDWTFFAPAGANSTRFLTSCPAARPSGRAAVCFRAVSGSRRRSRRRSRRPAGR